MDVVNPAMWPESWRKNVCENCGVKLTEISHATVKPLALMEWLVKMVCPESGICLDPLMGSGTTGVACMQTGRKFVGIEISEEYLEIAVRRMEEACAKSD